MIDVWVEQAGGSWFGIAEHDGRLVATVMAESRDGALRSIRGCLHGARDCRFPVGHTEFARATLLMLARLEAGDESGKSFELDPELVPEPERSVLRAAASIPLGYVSTYGDIASVSGTNARVVGGFMASNPLYPIVPCHRVVGSDMSLVGYTGRRTGPALRAKLERLRAEARGFSEERQIASAGGLRVVPVERVLAKAHREAAAQTEQLSLW